MLQCRDVSHRANGYNRIHQNGCLLLATFESDGKNVLHPLLDCHLSLILFQDLVMDYKIFLVHMSRDTNVIFFLFISALTVPVQRVPAIHNFWFVKKVL